MEKVKVIYTYDNTFEGLLSCIYDVYYTRFYPINIVADSQFNPTFEQVHNVETDYAKAEKVAKAISEKISKYTFLMLKDCFLVDFADKEMNILKYVMSGLKVGGSIYNVVSLDYVVNIRNAQRTLKREAHLFKGLVRFAKINDIYVAKIKPKHRVLSKIYGYFIDRNLDLPFVIYDEQYKELLMCSNGKVKIEAIDNLQIPDLDLDEKLIQLQWKTFYDTVAIKERMNLKCRQNFMPQRTWSNLVEMQ